MLPVTDAQTDPDLSRYIPGWVHRKTHQDAVDSILVPLGLYRKVVSQGDKFLNIDRWTLNFFTGEMMDWAEANPGRFPTRNVVRRWVKNANSASLSKIVKSVLDHKIEEKTAKPLIMIAATPARLSKRLALALRGGAFHEALHTVYDVRDEITFEEVWPVVEECWGLVDDWSKYASTVSFWANELSDIRNEQRGILEYPGIESALMAVHDWRIEKEFEQIEEARVSGTYAPNSHSFAMKAFRHFAFGYETATQKRAIDFAYDEDPAAVAYVTHGPLAPLVQAARRQWEMPRTAKVSLAMQTVATFVNHGMLLADDMLEALLGTEMVKLTWGHCRVCMDGKSNTSAPGGSAGSSIAEDALKDPQHMTTIEAVSKGVAQQTIKGASPMTYEFDKAYLVQPSSGGIGHDRTIALRISRDARRDITFYRSRLRTLVKAQEITGEHHGLPDGEDISDEMLVDTVMSIKEGKYPDAAYYDEDEQIDVSTSIYMLMDMSGSMVDDKIGACKIALSVVEAASDLGCSTMCSGFYSVDADADMTRRWIDSHYGRPAPGDEGLSKQHYRPWGVHHEVFKLWDEKHQHIRWRFANYRSSGGTPMADGIQFALNALQERKEGHRIMFVVTDGHPDPGTMDMINDLLSLAKSLGIIVVGCGFGPGSCYVEEVFPEHVWDNDIRNIPRLLVARLSKLMDYRGTLIRGSKTRQRVVPRRG